MCVLMNIVSYNSNNNQTKETNNYVKFDKNRTTQVLLEKIQLVTM